MPQYKSFRKKNRYKTLKYARKNKYRGGSRLGNFLRSMRRRLGMTRNNSRSNQTNMEIPPDDTQTRRAADIAEREYMAQNARATAAWRARRLQRAEAEALRRAEEEALERAVEEALDRYQSRFGPRFVVGKTSTIHSANKRRERKSRDNT